MVSWRAFSEIVGLDEKLHAEDHFTRVKGPASDIQQRLRVKVKGLVKPVSVTSGPCLFGGRKSVAKSYLVLCCSLCCVQCGVCMCFVPGQRCQF